jgi:peptide/nickel transport system permease protein
MILIVVIVGPLVLEADPMQTDPAAQLQAPGPVHLFGTDLLGRDVLSRTVHGGWQTLVTAALATVLVVILGLPLGSLSATGWRLVDHLTLGLINALLSLPSLLIALVVITLLGRGQGSVVIALGLSQAAPFAYTTRSAILAVRPAAYIEAATNLGARPAHVLLQHVLPNTQATLAAYTVVIFSYSLLNGAALGFLGLTGDLGAPEWGIMLAEGRAAFRSAPWISAAPGILISATVWAVNDLADQLVR